MLKAFSVESQRFFLNGFAIFGYVIGGLLTLLTASSRWIDSSVQSIAPWVAQLLDFYTKDFILGAPFILVAMLFFAGVAIVVRAKAARLGKHYSCILFLLLATECAISITASVVIGNVLTLWIAALVLGQASLGHSLGMLLIGLVFTSWFLLIPFARVLAHSNMRANQLTNVVLGSVIVVLSGFELIKEFTPATFLIAVSMVGSLSLWNYLKAKRTALARKRFV